MKGFLARLGYLLSDALVSFGLGGIDPIVIDCEISSMVRGDAVAATSLIGDAVFSGVVRGDSSETSMALGDATASTMVRGDIAITTEVRGC